MLPESFWLDDEPEPSKPEPTISEDVQSALEYMTRIRIEAQTQWTAEQIARVVRLAEPWGGCTGTGTGTGM